MSDEITNTILMGVKSYIQAGMTDHAALMKREAEASRKQSQKLIEESAKRCEKELEKKIAELAGTRARGPAVIAVLSVVFIAVAAFWCGAALDHAGMASWLFGV